MDKVNSTVAQEIVSLPYGFDDLDGGLRRLVAILRLHGFTVQRADDANESVGSERDLEANLSCPSVWIGASPAIASQANAISVIKANLEEQQRLLAFLKDFYEGYSADFYARLILETLTDYSCASQLRPQGGDIRIILDEEAQKKQLDQFMTEMTTFGDFLATKL